MLLKRHFERLLLSPADLKPLRDDFEVVGVFNPGAIVAGGEVILLVRVAERPRERRPGFTALPRWARRRGPGDRLAPRRRARTYVDPRVVKRKADGLVRLTFISHLRVVRCGDGRSVTGSDRRSVLARHAAWKNSGSRIRGSRRSTAGFSSPMSPSRAMARRRRWPRRPTSAASIGTGSSSVPRTRTWFCSRSESTASMSRFIVPTRRRRSAAPRCGSRGRRI